MSVTNLDKYKKLSEIDHVLHRPGRYIGSVVNTTQVQWLVEPRPFGSIEKFHQREITYNPGLLKLFDEIVSNSVDESKRNPKLNHIIVDVEPETGMISVWDNGGIPVKMHPEYQQWIPEMVFGELRSGSNFDDDVEETRTGAHGEGSSLVNIFSTKFIVETCDGEHLYRQVWENNLKVKHDPEVNPILRSGFTKITFYPEMSRLGGVLDGDMLDKLLKRSIDIVASNPNIKLKFNGVNINFDNFLQYIKMYHDDGEEIIYDDTDTWKVGVSKSDDGFKQISFVNSTETMTGGTHIDYISNQIVSSIREFIQKKHKVDVKPSEIKSHIRLFIDCKIVNPRYNSQTKEFLITEPKNYKTSWNPTPKFIKNICDSSIISSIINWVEARAEMARRAELQKHAKDLKKFDPRTVEKFNDATTKNREEAMLFIVEGDSAAGGINNNRNTSTMGCFPLRGKPVNVSELSIVDAMRNKEFKNLIAIAGLLPDENNTSCLRFGKLVIATDADYDGFHIRGLILNMFNAYFPELLRDGRIYILRTPIAKVQYKRSLLKFYSVSDLQVWEESHKGEKYSTKYYKGLGTSTDEEWQEYLTTENLEEYMVQVTYDEKASHMLDYVFGKGVGKADGRKEWLAIEEV